MADPTPDPSTRKLVGDARQGREAGFAALYDRVAPALHAWGTLQFRTTSFGVDPDDLVQEVFVRAMGKFDGFDETARPFRAWVFRIAKNVLLEAHRKARQMAAHPEGSSQDVSVNRYPDEATTITRRAARHEAAQRLVELAGSLSREEQDLLLDCGLEGRSLADVARGTGATGESVKKRWQRLRSRLRTAGSFHDLLCFADD